MDSVNIKKPMTKEEGSKIVKIAEGEVKKFIKKWKRNPYLWDTEADVHGELYIRIKKAIKRLDRTNIKERYEKYMSKKERFNRIYCKPLTYVKRGNYYPDIVIYEDYKCDKVDKRINEPMLWVCEIKYKTQWGGDQCDKNRKYDRGKLRRLLQQRRGLLRGARYAYFLNLERTKKKAASRGSGRVKLKKGRK